MIRFEIIAHVVRSAIELGDLVSELSASSLALSLLCPFAISSFNIMHTADQTTVEVAASCVEGTFRKQGGSRV